MPLLRNFGRKVMTFVMTFSCRSNMSAPKPTNKFEQASQQAQPGLVQEFIAFLGENKKFWMIPLLLALFALGTLLILGGTAAAPFIYTLF